MPGLEYGERDSATLPRSFAYAIGIRANGEEKHAFAGVWGVRSVEHIEGRGFCGDSLKLNLADCAEAIGN